MKILWVTNAPIGKHCEMTKASTYGGGWMTSALEKLTEDCSLELCIVTTGPLKERAIIRESNIEYVMLPGGYPLQYDHKKKNNSEEWKQLVARFKPDLIHIHGTEFAHGLALMRACPNNKYVISIQGLCSVYERYYYAGIDISLILRNITIRDVFRGDTIIQARRKFQKRGVLEREYIKRTRHVIGRTSWDFVHTNAINNKVHYHFCNESYRSVFYNKKWDIKKIKRNSIFISQAIYPIKGMHFVIKAVNILKMEFNDIQLYIAGHNITKSNSLITKLRISGYAKYLRHLIKRYSLNKYVNFTESLSAEQMVLYYQNSHVFICPSSIENSPNSLGEAQMIGTPCIASYVGGIPDMVKHGESGLLYPFEEHEMLAYHISNIFNNDRLAMRLSDGGKKTASERNNREINKNRLIEIYREIYNDEKY